MGKRQRSNNAGRKQLVYSSNIDWYGTRDLLQKSNVPFAVSRKGIIIIHLPHNVIFEISGKGTLNIFYDSRHDPRFIRLKKPITFKEVVLDFVRAPEGGTASTYTLDDLLRDKLELFATTDGGPLKVKLERQLYYLPAALEEMETFFYEYINCCHDLETKNSDFMDLMNV